MNSTDARCPPLPAPGVPELVASALAGVMRNAQEGELPLFAWTLGLPQPALMEMVAHCFPELGVLEPLPAQQYAALVDTAPAAFHALAALLWAHRTPSAASQHAAWLAQAVAAACFGHSHLWEELGLAGREQVSSLMGLYFEPLARRNTDNLRWKHFLFQELGRAQGQEGMRPPGCQRCEQAALCFPTPQ